MGLISDNLRAALRHEGYAKVATALMQDQGEYVNDSGDLSDAVRSISVKIATNRENEKIIKDGLESYKALR